MNKITLSRMKMRLTSLFFLFTLFILAGCVPGTEKSSLCPTGQSFDQTKRSCVGTVTGINSGGPQNTLTSASMSEDTPKIIYLSYSDVDNDLATACTVSLTAPYSNFSSASTCTCDSSGVCSVVLTPDSDENDGNENPATGFSFTYSVTTNGNVSTATTVPVTVAAVDDAVHDTASISTLTPLVISGAPTSGQLNTRLQLYNSSLVVLGTQGASSTSTKTFTALETDTTIYAYVTYADKDQGNHSVEIVNTQNVTATSLGCTQTGTWVTTLETADYGICIIQMSKSTYYAGAASVSFRLRSLSGVIYNDSGVYTISGSYTEIDNAPVTAPGSIATINMTEETEKIITLPFTDADGDAPTTCSISAISSSVDPNIYPAPVANDTLSITTACACVANTCTVGLTPRANSITSLTTFSFKYDVTTQRTVPVLGVANTSALSSTVTVNSVSNLADNPIGTVASPLTATEDSTSTITLGYIDPDVYTATGTTTACATSGVTNGTLSTCTCTSAGVCTTVLTPTANFAGTVNFNYTITRGSRTSTATAVAITVNASNDAPTISLASTTSTNMNTPVYVPIILNEGGGTDEDTQTLSLTSAVATNAALIPTVTIVDASEVAYADGATDVAATSWYLKITPDDNTYGVTNVTVTMTDGTTSVNSTIAVTINPVYAVHNGWKNIQAVGNKTDGEGAMVETQYVRLDWEDFDIFGSSLNATTAYNVYRGTSAGGIDFKTPLNTTAIASTQKYFIDTDTTLVAGTTYYYAVRPIDATFNLPIRPYNLTSTLISSVTTAENYYGIVDITMPRANMSLLHRWAVNKEVCQRMGRNVASTPVLADIDANNDFRCGYRGPGDVVDGGQYYYDFTTHAEMDVMEVGCNYTKNECGPDGCIGSGHPNINGCNGSACTATASVPDPVTFYDRSSGICYYTITGSTWDPIDSYYSTNLLDNIPLNHVHLPPLTNITPALAEQICEDRDAAYDDRLPKRPEFIAASGWSTSLGDTSITTIEAGTNLSSSSGCNSSAAAGLTISSGASLPTVDTDTLPSSTASTQRTLITASTTTQTCRSRYDIQDLVGNVREYNLETMTCDAAGDCNAGGTTASSAITVLPTAYTDQWKSASSATIFTLRDTGAASSMDEGLFTSWKISLESNNYNYFFIPYGLPVSDIVGVYAPHSIGTSGSSGITAAQLHEDFVGFNTSTGAATRIVTSGGSYSDGNQAGRYALDMVPTSTSDSKTGFRCIRRF